MIVFKRSEYDKGIWFDSEDDLKDFFYNDYKTVWTGRAPFEREDIVIERTENEIKRVGFLRFNSTVYTIPHWIGFCTIE